MGDRGGFRGLAGRELSFAPLLGAAGRHKVALILTFGVVARLGQYRADRPLWMDEASLAGCVRGVRSVADLFGPLPNAQLAPVGFLAAERLATAALGATRFALRLFPLACGVGALFAFRAVAGRVLRPRAALIALALFAVSDDLIYFASELKPYATDVLAGLLCTLAALAATPRPGSAARLAALGALAVWFSFPSAFVLAGVGGVMLASALARREWARSGTLGLVALAWLASFAGVYAVSRRQLVDPHGMAVFWAFAFPTVPPTSLRDAAWPLRCVSSLFVNPLGLEPALAPVSLGFFLVGIVSLGRRDRRLLAVLTAPGVVALLASYPRLYPFHGRLVLFLVPSLLLLIAEGADWVGSAVGRRAGWAVVLAALLLSPTVRAVLHLAEPRDRGGYNPHGDRLPAPLDPGRFPQGGQEAVKGPSVPSRVDRSVTLVGLSLTPIPRLPTPRDCGPEEPMGFGRRRMGGGVLTPRLRQCRNRNSLELIRTQPRSSTA